MLGTRLEIRTRRPTLVDERRTDVDRALATLGLTRAVTPVAAFLVVVPREHGGEDEWEQG